jgi:hypothetical protein
MTNGYWAKYFTSKEMGVVTKIRVLPLVRRKEKQQ